jgi:hypothetical protein
VTRKGIYGEGGINDEFVPQNPATREQIS